ncbi:hypothetical protein SAMN04487910_0598 [Aquimarina amphilecti]|uniref:Tetratricopeptide repeat-containing protein n=1 Tax=Aquimarina amphilecti TaxID=1038014 RepID=A0A1H7H9K8_AQUAM|nr:hypothetical protein [Aquimarina amphilecti]SEK46941.1 hypothetical protein SAMN04487910_0598 [Aquimarina amphilecti]
MKKVITSSLIVLFFININYTFAQTENNRIENSLDYFNQRNEALSLVKSKKWKEAIPILESLTKHYQNDADLFYILRARMFSKI